MADDDEIDDDEITAGLEKKRLSGKMMIMIGVPVLLIIIAAVIFFMMGGDDEHAEDGGADTEHADDAGTAGDPDEELATIFVDMPEMLINLNSAERQSRFLKIQIALEVDRESTRLRVEELMPRIVDNFQVYLRELRVEELSGSAGMFRLKEELLIRINASIAPAQVKDVLFKEMIVQ